MHTARENENLGLSNVEITVANAQDRGESVYIVGWSADEKYALISVGDTVTIAYRDSFSYGRWECSREHLRQYSDVYAERFPRPSRTV